MYLRLAFSVAAHLEPDILVVDEVLAVGDAEFQRKCLGRMDEAERRGSHRPVRQPRPRRGRRSCARRRSGSTAGTITAAGGTDSVIDSYVRAATSPDREAAPIVHTG